ncbi:MAG: hypothetical protein ACWIPH_00530 [Ostreibacterium sp.]
MANIEFDKPVKLDVDRRFVKRLAIHAGEDNSIFVGLRRAYVLPTQKGLYYLLTLAVIFVWSVNYALSLGYVLTFLTAIFGLLLAVLTVSNLASVRIIPLPNVAFFADSPAFFRIKIENSKQDPSIAVKARRNGLLSSPVTMLGQDYAILEVPLNDNTRGRKNLGYLHLSSDYPIGVFRSWAWLYFDAQLIIYPCPIGDLSLPFLPEHKGFDEGQVDSHGFEDFNDLKDYQAGDNIRHIVWKKIGTGQGNHSIRVKRFQDLAGQECILDFDDKNLAHLQREERLSQLCQWILSADSLGIKYALRLPSQRIDFGIGSTHKNACLEALACF